MKIPIEKVVGIVDKIIGYYPENIFIPPSKESFAALHKMLKQDGGSLDAISAELFRICLRIVRHEFNTLHDNDKADGALYLRLTTKEAVELRQGLNYLICTNCGTETLSDIADNLTDEIEGDSDVLQEGLLQGGDDPGP